MSAKHTPGLLNIVTQYAQPELRAASGELVAVVADYEVEDARRLASCWNACDGISTEHLERHGLPDFAQKISDLVAQRDELLEAIAGLVGCIDHGSENPTEKLDAARAAIAKAIG